MDCRSRKRQAVESKTTAASGLPVAMRDGTRGLGRLQQLFGAQFLGIREPGLLAQCRTDTGALFQGKSRILDDSVLDRQRFVL